MEGVLRCVHERERERELGGVGEEREGGGH